MPLLAAVLLATSCSKDDDANVSNGRDGVHTVSTTESGMSLSIRVKTGNSLNKIAYDKEGVNYQPSFDDNDANTLKMTIKEGNTKLGELTLQSDLLTFSGNISAPSSETTDLTAEIFTTGTRSSSNKSLADLLRFCAHTFSGTFKPNAESVTVKDQNAYLAITMSPCCNHDITINGNNYTVKNGRIWVAVEAGEAVTSEGLGKNLNKSASDVQPGKIYTVARQYFSVSSNKKIYFSKGNLQYNPHTNKKCWRFAEHQYERCFSDENNNVAGMYSEYYDGWLDLFGWGMWLDGTEDSKIINYLKDNSQYNPALDADNNFRNNKTTVDGEVWNTLTRGEWSYLMSSKSDKWGVAEVADVPGMIILPDDWIMPEGIAVFKNGVASSFGVDKYATKNKYNTEAWSKMEQNGAIFLPAAGVRSINNSGAPVVQYLDRGGYWTASYVWSTTNGAEYFFIWSNQQGVSTNSRWAGQSVRLVRPL